MSVLDCTWQRTSTLLELATSPRSSTSCKKEVLTAGEVIGGVSETYFAEAVAGFVRSMV